MATKTVVSDSLSWSTSLAKPKIPKFGIEIGIQHSIGVVPIFHVDKTMLRPSLEQSLILLAMLNGFIP